MPRDPLFRTIALGVVCLLPTLNVGLLADDLLPVEGGADAKLNNPLLDGSEADDLDALLDLAEQDFSSVSKVNVTAPSLNMEVTTVSRKTSTVGRSAAAVFVITNEMIQRSGAINVPEALRQAPGVQVARITAHEWAISIRGFNSVYAKQLQVQVDGRSIYTPLFGGVIWGMQDMPLSEVQRIEIIRGPGASVWGANAVNGVINIITKDAKDTQGLFVQAGTGTVERGLANVRYGKELTKNLFARVYGSWLDHDHHSAGPDGAFDQFGFNRIGMRVDDDRYLYDRFTFSANYYVGDAGVSSDVADLSAPPYLARVTGDNQNEGTNVQWHWEHEFTEQTKSSLRLSYNHNRIEAPLSPTGTGMQNHMEIFDADYQLQHQLAERHSLVMGVGYKSVASRTVSAVGVIDFLQPDVDFHLMSAFVQDEISLIEDELYLTLGAKASDNTFTGFEVQPTARVLWLPDDKHSVWAAVSRAVRLPTLIESSGQLTLPAFVTNPVYVLPNEQVASKLKGYDLTAFEVGIRGQPVETFSWDFAAFANRYDNMGRGTEGGLVPFAPGVFLWAYQRGNSGSAETYGAELSGLWDVTDDVKLRGAYTYTLVYGESVLPPSTPVNQLHLQASFDLSKAVKADVAWRYVDSVDEVVANYNAMDLRLAWAPTPHFEWSVVARNLLDDKHPEFSTTATGGSFTQVPTSVYSMVTWKY